MEDLLSLPGVGRKTANLILGDVYGKPAVVTDTHFIRICGKLGLTNNKVPVKVEEDLQTAAAPRIQRLLPSYCFTWKSSLTPENQNVIFAV